MSFFSQLVAIHRFDPGRINFFEPFGPGDIDMKTKKGMHFCNLSVKVQYVRGSDYFTCPSCNILEDHTPIVLLGNLQGVTLDKESLYSKGLKLKLKVGNLVGETPLSKDGQFNHHIMVNYASVKKSSNLTLMLCKHDRCVHTSCIAVKDLMGGNVCDLYLPIKNSKWSGSVHVLLQLIYSCSDCIVEREENGVVDIPKQRVQRRPDLKSLGGLRVTPPCVQPIQGMSSEPQQDVQNIPGMGRSNVQAQPSSSVSGAQPMQPMRAQPVQPMQAQPVQPMQAQPVQSVQIQTVSAVSLSAFPVATPLDVPTATPAVVPMNGSAMYNPVPVSGYPAGYTNSYGAVQNVYKIPM